MSDGNPIGWILAGGGGTVVGTLLMAVIQTLTGRGEARAHAADMITEAASNLADRQSATIERLEKRSQRQAAAIIALTAVVDELIDQIPISVSERVKLQKAVNTAKLAV